MNIQCDKPFPVKTVNSETTGKLTQDEIIAMAREAERYANNHCDESEFDDWYTVRDERFANQVAEAKDKEIAELKDFILELQEGL